MGIFYGCTEIMVLNRTQPFTAAELAPPPGRRAYPCRLRKICSMPGKGMQEAAAAEEADELFEMVNLFPRTMGFECE